MFDPPFMFEKRNRKNNNIMNKRFSMYHNGFDELKKHYKGTLKEAYRILKKRGVMIFKCQDFTDSKTTITHCFVNQWANNVGFYVKDLFILLNGKGAIINVIMKRKPTFFNTRNERLYWNYSDTNNWLFTINYKAGEIHREQNYILRYLKKDNINLSYIYKKIHARFDVVEIEASKMSKTEYDLLKNIETPSINNCVKIKPIFKKELSEAKASVRQDYELQEV
jgi:hypothetical protein